MKNCHTCGAPVGPDGEYFEPKPATTRESLIDAARVLLDGCDGSNPEYSRAIVELICDASPGLNQDDYLDIEKLVLMPYERKNTR